MDTVIDTYLHEGLTVSIYLDENSESPRDWDNLGKLLIFPKYQTINELGKNYRTSDYSGWDEFAEAILADLPGAEVLPVFRYEHSTVLYNTVGFNDLWDSCQVGFIICPREDIVKEYSLKRVSSKVRGKVRRTMAAEVATYSQWAYGDIYGFIITDAHDNSINLDGNTCWGYYGIDAVKEAANEAAEAIAPEWFGSAESRAAVQEFIALEAAGQQRLAFAQRQGVPMLDQE